MITAAKSKMQDYISNVEFSLNFEDRTSIKVKIGEIVAYDGLNAKYRKSSGEEIIGRTLSLQSAITRNWLTLNVNGAKSGPIDVKVDKIREGVPLLRDGIVTQEPKFDKLIGGSFDKFLQNSNDITYPGKKVITEEDRIAKKSKREVVGDQVSVKDVTESTTVSSTTASTQTPKSHSTKIMKSDQYNAESSTPRKSSLTAEQKKEEKKVNTFTVDDTTPRVSDDTTLTLNEIHRITKPIVKDAQSQDAKVVKKVSRMKLQVEEIEGITLKNSTGTVEKEIDVSAKVSSGASRDIDTSAKTSSGSTPITDLSEAKTQDQVNKISKKETKSEYLDKLPEDWSKMHWVRKEQFIQQQTDKEFIKFILMVDITKAIQNACKKRLVELEKLAMQK